MVLTTITDPAVVIFFQGSSTLLINFYFPQCWCPLPSNVASPVTTPAVASIVGSFSGLPSKTKENTNKDQMLS